MDASLIIPAYNAKKTLRKCVQSILNSDFSKTFEIIVVDDGSSDNSIDTIKGLDVRIIKQKNAGASASRNNGARHAKSEILLFVDSDVEFCKDTLRRIHEQLSKEDVDFVTPRYSRIPINKKWVHKYKAIADHCYYYRFIFLENERKRPIPQVSLGGGVDCIKKRVFNEIGGYDERIKGAGVEKEIMYIELFKNYRVYAYPNIKTRHNFPNFMPLAKNYFYRTIESMELMHNRGYKAQNLKKNTRRIFIGSLVPFSILLSAILFRFISSNSLFFLPVSVFLIYLLLHLEMYTIALKDNGVIFMFYSLIVNLFFCSLITFAGAVGIANIALKK